MTRSPRRCATASGRARTIFSKPVDRRVHREAHLLDLVRVLDQPQLGERLGQHLVALARRLGRADLLDQRLDRLVDVGRPRAPARRPRRRPWPDASRRSSTCAVRTPGEGLEVLQGRARAHPELAVAGVGEELLGVPAGQRADVEDGVVAAAVVARAVLDGVQDEHGVGLLLGAQAREVRERGVRAEPVVGVVGPRLEVPAGMTSRSPGNRADSAERRVAVWSAAGLRWRVDDARSPQPDVMNRTNSGELGRWERLLPRSASGCSVVVSGVRSSLMASSSHPRPGYREAVRIDLHTHSSASDGTDAPAQVVAAAAAAGLDVVALTDHDTTAGWAEAAAAARRARHRAGARDRGVGARPRASASTCCPTCRTRRTRP